MKNDIIIDSIGMIDEEIIAEARTHTRIKRRIPLRLIAAVAALLVLALTATVTASAAAAGNDEAYQLLYQFSPSIAQQLKPVNLSCVDNGIRMEVISADISGNEAYIYVSIEDKEGDRIDGSLDLFDCYDINRSFDCAAGCSLVDYNEDTGKAVFLIHITAMEEDRMIRGGKITFSAWCLLSNKIFIDEALPIDLSLVSQAKETQIVETLLFRGDIFSKELLSPQDGGIYTPGKGAQITAIGYIDGRLHIQMRLDEIWRTDNHGWLSLIDADGNEIEMEYYEFHCGERSEHRIGRSVFQGYESLYQEYIADISPEELASCTLWADLTLCDTMIEGDWQVTFPLENSGA